MKGVVSFVLAAGLGLSSLSAVESKALSQSDREFLFASNEVRTQVLSEQEMSETKGEFLETLAAISGIVSGVVSVYQLGDTKGWW